MNEATVNIAAPLREMARLQPETPALIVPHQNEVVCYGELDARTAQLARGLARRGWVRGMRVVLMVPPSVDFFALTFALFELGCVVVLIDPGMGIRNLGVCLHEAEPQAFIGVPRAHLARILLGWGRRTIRQCATVGTRFLPIGGTSLQQILEEGAAGPPVTTATTAEEMAAILFTSGSTGVAKGAVYTHGIFTAQIASLKRIYDIRPGEIDLPTFPLFGLFGPALGMTAILPRMNFIRPGQVDPRAILVPVQEYGVTNLFGSPALLRRVVFADEAQGVRLPSLRRVISAGAPVSPAVIAAVAERLGDGVQVHTPYGATEALPVSTIGSREILGETGPERARGKGVCVGKPVEGMHVRILRITEDPIPNWDEGLCLPQGEIGEIVVSGPVVTRTYYNRPTSTALHKIGQAGTTWHRMGDVGYLDSQGRIWFCGRKSHRVVTPEATFYTIPCEGIFDAHPAVFRTALVGVLRKGRIEPELCVEIDPALPREQRPDRNALAVENFRKELRALGMQFEHTRAIRRFLIHPCFPVDIRHNAKIFREKLAIWATRQRGGMVE